MGFTRFSVNHAFVISAIIAIQNQLVVALPFTKTLPEFSYATVKNSTGIDLNEDAPLNTGELGFYSVFVLQITNCLFN